MNIPAPEQDPRLGDKTPTYMQWLKQYHPVEYEKRYKGRKVPGIDYVPKASGEDVVPRPKKEEEWK